MTLKNLALSDSNGDVNLRIPSRSKSIFKTNYEEYINWAAQQFMKEIK